MVIKEWKCLQHGSFEAAEAVCPRGCTTVIEREFRTAPGGVSDRTKGIDRSLQSLAARYGFTDMSNKNGSVGNSMKTDKNSLAGAWHDLPKSDREKKNDVINPLLQQIGVAPETGDIPTGTDIIKHLPKPRPSLYKPAFGTNKDLADAVYSSD